MLAAGGLLVSGLFLMPHSLNGQEVAGAPENYQTRPSPHFKPNKGQVADHEGNLIKAYEYVYQAPGMKVGLKQNGFHYNLYTVEEKAKPDKKVSEATGKPANAKQRPERPGDEETAKQRTYHYHRVEVAFKGANEDPEIIAGKQMDYYANYYLGYLPEHVTNVHGYRKLTYKNLYDNIDLVLRPETAEKGQPKLKYNIRVRPGGDLSDVKLVYKGMDKLSLENGKLQIATSQGHMTETIPKSYWAESKEATTVNYQLEGNTVSFHAEQQREGQTLVVDPSLSWSTFLGGPTVFADETSKGVTTDGSGNVYVTGRTDSKSFPTTSGAYQTSGGGFDDAFLSKFTSSGSLSWSTYLGGSDIDRGEGVTTDGSGNVYVTGEADSGFPTTSGAYQPSHAGGNDAFLSKFTSGGSLSWSTFLGGSNDDGGNGVTTDGIGNVYVTGNADTTFPTTNGAYQGSFGGGVDDAFLSKFTSNGSLSWSTYLGGNNSDYGSGVTTDGSGNVYVTGYADTTFPTTSGAYQPSHAGGNDAFLSKFTSGGSLSWSTYLGGSNVDYGNGVTTDGSGNVYVTGKARSGFPTTSGAYQTSYGGGGNFGGSFDAFLSKFTSSGSLSWSTYLGGSNIDGGNGVTTDGSGNVYVTGDTYSNNFPTTSGAYQTSNAGSGDAFLSKFSSRGSLSYSTFLGGNSFNDGYGVTTDGSENVYVTGDTYSNNFPTTSGAYQQSYGGGADAFLSQFDFSGTGTSTSSLDFDGSDDYVNCGDIDAAEGDNALTVEAWVKLSSTSQETIATKWNHSSDDVWGFRVENSNELRFFVARNLTDKGVNRLETTNASLSTGKWIHLAAVYDGTKSNSADRVTIYKNGKALNSQETGTIPSTMTATNNAEVWIGAFENLGFYMDGFIDELRIWDDSRTKAEINQLKHQQIDASKYPDLVGYWRMNDGSGQTVSDETSNTNDGTLGSTNSSDANDPSWGNATAALKDQPNLGAGQSFNKDIAAIWPLKTSNSSGGLKLAENSLFGAGDEMVFAHNGKTGQSNGQSYGSVTVDIRLDREWLIDDNTANNKTVDFTFTTTASGASGISGGTASDYVLINTSTSTIAQNGADNVNPANNTVTFNNVPINSQYTVGSKDASNSPLPVELVSFEGEQVGEEVQLSWRTASETNNNYFRVQRRAAEAWRELQRVEGHGTTITPQEYEAIDPNPEAGTNYYRLKQVDYDGSYEYSEVISVALDEPSSQQGLELTTYPAANAIRGEVAIASPGQYQLQLRNSQGKVVQTTTKSWQEGNHQLNLRLRDRAAGIYFLTIRGNKKQVHEKVVVR